jgi:beta-phosphoglucomutase-like phosphatase (HAD superfamily)
MTVKAVFFDIDGTLVDSNEFHVSAWERAFQEQLHPRATKFASINLSAVHAFDG